MRFTFTTEELKQMGISAIVLGFVFAWGSERFPPISLIISSLLGVGLAFILHETAHKLTAQRYGCWAEYRMWDMGLILAFFLVVTVGMVFAAPGAVYITPREYGMTKREDGIISVSGAIANLILALFFSVVGFELGATINAWLALFNMIPFPPLDGSKVITWSFPVWGLVILTALFLL